MQSIYLFIGIIVFFIAALVITNYIQRKRGNTQEREATPPAIDLSGGCCGAHEICERNSQAPAHENGPEYFDDEELDKYSHRDSSAYSEKEVEEFREVFYSVLDEEKPQWVKSLQLRNILLPDQIKDEVLKFINETRACKMHA